MTLVNRPSRPHRAYRGFTDEWLTPVEIIDALGPFDLDPCAPVSAPRQCAKKIYTVNDNGLSKPWVGRVWLNPPYGPLAAKFLEKLSYHGHGTALVFARTETTWFHDFIWDTAAAIIFIRGRLHFCDLNDERAKGNAGGPSVLAAYGDHDADVLSACGIVGKFISLKGANHA